MKPFDPKTSANTTPASRAAAIISRLCELGAHYDAEAKFPSDSLKCIADAGLHADFAPTASGGWAFETAADKNRSLMDVLRAIGRADLSAGRLYEGHVNALALIDWFGSDEQQHRLQQSLQRGDFYGVWATEPTPGLRLEQTGGKSHLQGSKSFASGAGGIQYSIVTATTEGPDRQLVIVAADDPARADVTQWNVRGMRATVSGAYDCSAMVVSPIDMLGKAGDYDREPRFTTGAWRFTAVQLGGIEALLSETRLAMSETARADPLQRAKFADSVAAARTAYLWVREAALRAARDDPDGPAFARMTRGIVERAALDVMEYSARIIGTRSAMDGQRIDKIIRDLSLYLRQAGPDYARDQAALAWLDHDAWGDKDLLW